MRSHARSYPARFLAAAVALAAAPLASAFSINDPARDATARSLDHTERWEITSSLDGLDYSIHDSVCSDLRFVDGTTCDQVKAAIRSTFDLWAAGHAYLHFVDVSATNPIFVEKGKSGIREIGVSSMAAATRNGFDWSDRLEKEAIGLAHVVSTRRRQGGSAIDEVGITMNDRYCFFLDFAKIDWTAQKSCAASKEQSRPTAYDFRAVLAHEIGHALGLTHPDLEAGVNFDDDDVRDNPIAIDCTDPAANLKVSPNISVYSVMNRSFDYPIERGLSYDDLAGRNFLYPACETAPSVFDATLRKPYSAIVAYSQTGKGEDGALSVSSWNPVISVRQALDNCFGKFAPERCRYAGGARGYIYTASRLDMAAGGKRSLDDLKVIMSAGDSEQDAMDAMKKDCEPGTTLRVCLPIGVFDPLDDPPPWLTLPEDEDEAAGEDPKPPAPSR